MRALDLSIVVTSWNTAALLGACLRSLEPAAQRGAQVIVVDDASSDGSQASVLREFPWVRLHALKTNRGYSAATNLGARSAERRWLMLLNADTEVSPGALEEMCLFLAANPAYGAVAPRLVDVQGQTRHDCMEFPNWKTALLFGTPLGRWFPRHAELQRYTMRAFTHEHERDVPQPPAAALMLPRSLWEDLAGFDPEFRLFFGDVDLCARMQQAARPIRYLPEAQVLHHGGASTGQLGDCAVQWHMDRLVYYRKHGGFGGALWVKLCTSWVWLAHVLEVGLSRLFSRNKPASEERLVPLFRSFGVYWVS